MGEDFYDKVYEAWMSGGNPDMVDADQYDYLINQGFYPDEISWKDIYPKEIEVEGWKQNAKIVFILTAA